MRESILTQKKSMEISSEKKIGSYFNLSLRKHQIPNKHSMQPMGRSQDIFNLYNEHQLRKSINLPQIVQTQTLQSNIIEDQNQSRRQLDELKSEKEELVSELNRNNIQMQKLISDFQQMEKEKEAV